MTKTHSKIAIIITAAGSSTRMGGSIKKEYLPFKNGTVLSNCAQTFLEACSPHFTITDFIITCPKDGKKECLEALKTFDHSSLASAFKIAEGSDTRQKSVYNGLLAIKNNPQIVLIHDGARPFVTSELILNCVNSALEFGASVPGLTPVDTQKEIDFQGFIVRHLQRSSLCAVQTPQCFDFEKLFKAHTKALNDDTEYTDDTEIWGRYCGKVKVVQGEAGNIKITYPSDLEKLKFNS